MLFKGSWYTMSTTENPMPPYIEYYTLYGMNASMHILIQWFHSHFYTTQWKTPFLGTICTLITPDANLQSDRLAKLAVQMLLCYMRDAQYVLAHNVTLILHYTCLSLQSLWLYSQHVPCQTSLRANIVVLKYSINHHTMTKFLMNDSTALAYIVVSTQEFLHGMFTVMHDCKKAFI